MQYRKVQNHPAVMYPYYDKTRDIQSDIASVKVSSKGQKTKGIIVAKGNI